MPLSRFWTSSALSGVCWGILICSLASSALAADIFVINTNDAGAGSLRQAMLDAQPGDTIQISATGTINLGSALPVINQNLTITGPGAGNLTISGQSLNRVFFVESGTVVINNLSISDGRAQGGNGGDGGMGGGGGGLGAGGGLFVNSGAQVTIENVVFSNNQAVGGNGGTSNFGSGGGGGGGLGGNGGSSGFLSEAGGGGGGSYQAGGDGSGTIGGGDIAGGTGGLNGGGTGSNGSGTGSAGGDFGGGGGGGGTDPMGPNATGGDGGFGGGGGGGWLVSGDGGFGGGGGGGQWSPGTGGTGGGSGFGQEGGGGAGFGGAIFVREGGSLIVRGESSTMTGSVTGGTPYGFAGYGQAAGAAIYLHNQNMTFISPTAGDIMINEDIAGTGGVVIQGTGTVHFRGTNSFTGGTLVSSGVLEGNCNGIHGDIINNSSVFINDMGDVNYGGGMSGTGSLTVMIAGNGTLTLNGTNSYSGGTWIEMGWLKGTTDSIQGNITNNSHLIFQQNTDGTYSGNIIGTGNFVKRGNGFVMLTGTNNYSGGTTVEAGTLGGTTSSLHGDIVNNARVVFDQAVSGTYTGAISGTGSLDKQGTGTVTLSGTNTYSGATNVLAGKLVVNGSLANTSGITVANGAQLGGSGTLPSLIANGTVRPGNSIGTLNISGDYTHNSSATYEVELNDAGQSDLIEVGGSAAINGGAVDVRAAPGSYSAGLRYRILHATGGVTGTFNSITDDLPFFGFDFLYGADYVDLLMYNVHLPFVGVAQTHNQNAVAANLDSVYFSATGDLATVVAALNVLSAADARTAFEQIDGEAYSNLAAINIDGANLFTNTAFNRTAFFNLSEYRETTGRQLWAYALGRHQGQESRHSFSGYDSDAGGVMVGCERQFDSALVGFGSGYLRNDTRFRGSVANDRSDMFNLTGYGKLERDQAYLAAVVGYTRGWNDVSRSIAFNGIATRQASSSVSGNMLGTLFQAGYHFDHGDLRLTPLAGMRYVYGVMGSAAESGADSLSLQMTAYNRTSMSTHFGGKLAYGMTRLWRAEAYAQWEHEFCDTASNVSMSLTGVPTGFLVQGAAFERDGARTGLIVIGQLTPRLSINLNYDALLRASYCSQQLVGGVEYGF